MFSKVIWYWNLSILSFNLLIFIQNLSWKKDFSLYAIKLVLCLLLREFYLFYYIFKNILLPYAMYSLLMVSINCMTDCNNYLLYELSKQLLVTITSSPFPTLSLQSRQPFTLSANLFESSLFTLCHHFSDTHPLWLNLKPSRLSLPHGVATVFGRPKHQKKLLT